MMIDILEEAAEIITGKRQEEYGPPEDSLRKIASFWSAYVNHEIEFTPQDVAFMMILLKVGRVNDQGVATRDTIVDVAGYAALAAAAQVEP